MFILKRKHAYTERVSALTPFKLFEHTWGGSTSTHMNVSRSEVAHVWTAADLRAAKNKSRSPNGYKFIEKMEATWDEQVDKRMVILRDENG